MTEKQLNLAISLGKMPFRVMQTSDNKVLRKRYVLGSSIEQCKKKFPGWEVKLLNFLEFNLEKAKFWGERPPLLLDDIIEEYPDIVLTMVVDKDTNIDMLELGDHILVREKILEIPSFNGGVLRKDVSYVAFSKKLGLHSYHGTGSTPEKAIDSFKLALKSLKTEKELFESFPEALPGGPRDNPVVKELYEEILREQKYGIGKEDYVRDDGLLHEKPHPFIFDEKIDEIVEEAMNASLDKKLISPKSAEAWNTELRQDLDSLSKEKITNLIFNYVLDLNERGLTEMTDVRCKEATLLQLLISIAAK